MEGRAGGVAEGEDGVRWGRWGSEGGRRRRRLGGGAGECELPSNRVALSGAWQGQLMLWVSSEVTRRELEVPSARLFSCA